MSSRPLINISGRLALEVDYEHPNHGVFAYQEEKAISKRLCFLSPETLAAVIGFLSKRKNYKCNQSVDEKYIWKIVKKYCFKNHALEIKSFTQFCIGSAIAMEKMSSKALPTFFRNYALGIISSNPAPIWNIGFRLNGDKKRLGSA